jgi:hypothetical protein
VLRQNQRGNIAGDYRDVCIANCQVRELSWISRSCWDWAVRDLAVLFLYLRATVARLAGPGGARSVVAESVLVKQQLLILNRSRKRARNLRLADRMVTGLCAPPGDWHFCPSAMNNWR